MKLRFCLPLLAALLPLLPACNQRAPDTATTTPPPPPAVPGPDLMALADSNAARLLLAYGREHPGHEVLVRTRLGNMRIRLYDDTPIHAANFLLLARKGVFDESVFNRVVKGPGNSGRGLGAAHHCPAQLPAAPRNPARALPQARGPGHGALRWGREPRPALVQQRLLHRAGRKNAVPPQARANAGRPLTPEQAQTYATLGGVPRPRWPVQPCSAK